jgi:hypothetical protein
MFDRKRDADEFDAAISGDDSSVHMLRRDFRVVQCSNT